MTKLAYLHEPGVLYNLSCRYGLNEIYVSTCCFSFAIHNCIPGLHPPLQLTARTCVRACQPDRRTPATS